MSEQLGELATKTASPSTSALANKTAESFAGKIGEALAAAIVALVTAWAAGLVGWLSDRLATSASLRWAAILIMVLASGLLAALAVVALGARMLLQTRRKLADSQLELRSLGGRLAKSHDVAMPTAKSRVGSGRRLEVAHTIRAGGQTNSVRSHTALKLDPEVTEIPVLMDVRLITGAAIRNVEIKGSSYGAKLVPAFAAGSGYYRGSIQFKANPPEPITFQVVEEYSNVYYAGLDDQKGRAVGNTSELEVGCDFEELSITSDWEEVVIQFDWDPAFKVRNPVALLVHSPVAVQGIEDKRCLTAKDGWDAARWRLQMSNVKVGSMIRITWDLY